MEKIRRVNGKRRYGPTVWTFPNGRSRAGKRDGEHGV